jgi:plasmid stabilization system protein ParE
VRVVLSPHALADLDRLKNFLSDKNPPAADRMMVALIEAIDSLVHFPGRGRPGGEKALRELVVPFGSGAYVVRYAALSGDEIVIIRIWHGREMR